MINVPESKNDAKKEVVEKEDLAAAREESFIHFSNPNDQTLHRLVLAVDKAYNKPGLLMWRGFCYGFMTAVGATVGTAFVIAVSTYAFSFFGGFKYIQNGFNNLTNTITNSITSSTTSTINDISR